MGVGPAGDGHESGFGASGLLTAEEAAESLKVGRCKVYDLIRSGELESIKIGRLRRIPVDSLRRFAQRMLAEGLE